MSHQDESRHHPGYEKLCDQLMAELAKFEWRPIETAPDDGRLALVFRPLAHMSKDENIAVKKLIGGNQTCWNVTVPAGETPCNPTNGACHVTHWMPLPGPPKQSADLPPFLQNQAE